MTTIDFICLNPGDIILFQCATRQWLSTLKFPREYIVLITRDQCLTVSNLEAGEIETFPLSWAKWLEKIS